MAWRIGGPHQPKRRAIARSLSQAQSELQDRIMKLGKARGFTLLELLITLAIGFVMAGVTVLALVPLFKQNKVDAAYDTTLSVLRTYRSQAIAQSKRYIITFIAPGTIQVQYWGVGVPVSPAPVTVATYQLPADIQFAVQAGFPPAAPDGFGAGGTAIDFDQGMGLGSQDYVMFMPDGSSQDTLGNYNSGVLYLGRPGDLYSSGRSRCLELPDEFEAGASTTRRETSGCSS